MRAYAMLALLGLAQSADPCVYEAAMYKTADCTGDVTATSTVYDTETDKCKENTGEGAGTS
tara:strand:+ start:160 stop:342 length:183 start_codon:yes stop_codon:yes gene_type:complete